MFLTHRATTAQVAYILPVTAQAEVTSAKVKQAWRIRPLTGAIIVSVREHRGTGWILHSSLHK